ncbi:hypothetical protein [Winogradskyella sp.]|uniref:hypothetical protein n=1 Tax=Winogradskyella sp. TaxID=1883156 RepID=UPI0035145BDF
MHIISKFFKVNASETILYKIILWWELRRIPYNIFLLLTLSFTIYIISFLPNEGYIKVIAGPGLVVGFYLTILLYFIGANILYTLGCIFQILTRTSHHKYINLLKEISFILGLSISIVVTLSPCLALLVNFFIG